nr:PREDICTED: uncharacterized protein LOC107078828 [Lepisosteus oculatus]
MDSSTIQAYKNTFRLTGFSELLPSAQLTRDNLCCDFNSVSCIAMGQNHSEAGKLEAEFQVFDQSKSGIQRVAWDKPKPGQDKNKKKKRKKTNMRFSLFEDMMLLLSCCTTVTVVKEFHPEQDNDCVFHPEQGSNSAWEINPLGTETSHPFGVTGYEKGDSIIKDMDLTGILQCKKIELLEQEIERPVIEEGLELLDIDNCESGDRGESHSDGTIQNG